MFRPMGKHGDLPVTPTSEGTDRELPEQISYQLALDLTERLCLHD